MAYSVLLNNTIVNDEPKGLNDIVLKIKRDAQLSGLFVLFTTDLHFIGDGYTLIKDYIAANGVCGRISVEISDTDPTGFGFRGIMEIAEMEDDISRCIMKAKVEDDTYAGRILRLKNFKVPINTGLTLNGEALAGIGDLINLGTGTKLCYKTNELLQYILSYLSDNNVVLDSDFYTTNYTSREWTILLGGTVAISDVITYSYTNIFNETVSGTLTATSTSLQDLTEWIAKNIVWRFNNSTGENIFSFDFTKLYYAHGDPAYSGALNTILIKDIQAVNNFTISSNGATTFTITNTVSFVNGAGNMYVSTGARLNNIIDYTDTISLTEIFEALNKVHNIGFRFYIENGVYTYKIEQQQDLFIDTTTVTINNIFPVKNNFTKEFRYSVFQYKSGNPNEYEKSLSEQSWATDGCGETEKDLQNKFWFGTFLVGAGFASMSNQDKAFIFSTNGTSIDVFDFTLIDGLAVLSTLDINTTSPLYSLPISAPLVIKNHSFLNGDLTNDGHNITSDSDINITGLHEFEALLTCDQFDSQFDSLVNAVTNKIIFDTGDPLAFLSGWINELNYEVKSGKTNFKLYTE